MEAPYGHVVVPELLKLYENYQIHKCVKVKQRCYRRLEEGDSSKEKTINICFDTLSEYFQYPLLVAAKKIDISPTALKWCVSFAACVLLKSR
jgi:hypothetical protein